MKAGMMAEFDAPESLVRALGELRRLGYRDIDAFTPYPIEEVQRTLGLTRSPINRLVLPFAVGAAGLAYFIQWGTNAYDYPLDVGGRPLHSAPAFIPITYELGVLVAALSAVIFLFGYMGLPELHSPIFAVEGFESATRDRFWVGVDYRDPAFDAEGLRALLGSLGATRIDVTGATEP